MRYKLLVRVLEEPLKEFYVSVPLTPEQFAAQVQASLSANKFFTFMCERKPNEVFFGKADDITYIHAIALPEPERSIAQPEPAPNTSVPLEARRRPKRA